MKNPINSNYQNLSARIEKATQEQQRSAQSVKLIAVSKKHSSQSIRHAYDLGIRDFGENYLQEALDKQQQLQDLAIEWHYIGAIQSNKTQAISESFNWVHTVSRIKIAKRLNQQRPEHLAPINCCIQYNISDEDNKSGIVDDQQLLELAQYMLSLKNLRLRGLMAIPAFGQAQSEQGFAQLKDKLDKLRTALIKASGSDNENNNFDPAQLDTLSMGMSADLESAIAHGSTMLRVGTALFGERD